MATALITGASSGIGYELAQVYAREGYDVIVTARNESALQELKARIQKQYSVQVHVVPADLSLQSGPQDLCAKVQKLNISIDVLVNNAGFGELGPFIKGDWSRYQQMIQVNITALTEISRFFAPQFAQRGSGHIVNIASTASFQAGPWMAVYYATKAYVLSFSEALAEELKPAGVKVLALCPGPTHSGFQAAANMGNIPLFGMMKVPGSREVAEYTYKKMQDGSVIAVQGFMNRFGTLMTKIAPRSMTRKIAMKLQESKR